MRKNLISMLGAVALGVASMLPNEGNTQGTLSIVNYSNPKINSPHIGVNYVFGGEDVAYTNPAGSKVLGIYDSTTPSESNSQARVDSASNIFTQKLYYSGNITANVTTNQLRFRFFTSPVSSAWVNYSTFPSNMLINAKVFYNNGLSQVMDVVAASKLYSKDESNTNGCFCLPVILKTNTLNSIDYATCQVSFATKESSIPKLESPVLDLDKTNAAVTVANVLPGENIILESTTNLNDGASWLPVGTNYLGVTLENFGKTDLTTFTNLPAIDKQRFFRARVQ